MALGRAQITTQNVDGTIVSVPDADHGPRRPVGRTRRLDVPIDTCLEPQ